jgi:aquaporin Z
MQLGAIDWPGKTPERSPSLQTPSRTLLFVVRHNWRLYLYEAIELALFMLSACGFTIILFDPSWFGTRFVHSEIIRRVLMALAMGITAVLIIRSPLGKRSGAHFNPAITLTYLRLGKIVPWDAVFYVLFQFLGGILGVAVAAAMFGRTLSSPSINYAVTVPGRYGTLAAFIAELLMAVLLMTVVLLLSNRAHLATYVSYSVGILIAVYAFFLGPVSGFSINPARTTGSAVFAGVWTAVWLYFVAPLLGMFCAAEIYSKIGGDVGVLCAKLHPAPDFPCPFICEHPEHRRTSDLDEGDSRPHSS